MRLLFSHKGVRDLEGWKKQQMEVRKEILKKDVLQSAKEQRLTFQKQNDPNTAK